MDVGLDTSAGAFDGGGTFCMNAAASCRLCGRETAFWFSKAGRDLYRCPSCGHVEVPAGLARLADGRSIYEGENAVFTVDGNADYYLDESNLLAARAKLLYVRKFCSDGVLVDVGASYGQFLSVASKVFDATGFELSPEAVAFSRTRFGVRNVIGSLYEWPAAVASRADVITCWDVIEHVEDPSAAIRAMAAHLKPGGWMFLSTPDAASAAARMLGQRWHYLDPVQHINLFSRANLERVLRDAGLEPRHARIFGRQYRVSYIVNRLAYLHGDGAMRKVISGLSYAAWPARRLLIPITLGDVMGIAARMPS